MSQTFGRRVLASVGAAVLSLSQGAAQAGPSEAWQTIPLVEAGFAEDLGTKLDSAVAAGGLNGLHAVLVVRKGKLALERYYAGADERWGDPLGEVAFGPEVKHDLRSVSKSVVGLLYGVALDKGQVPALDQPLVDHFPAYPDLAADQARRRITVAHALTMTMGIEWSEDLPYSDPRNSEIAMELAPDRYRYVLERPIVSAPGERWVYNGGATALLARLIAKGSGQPLFDYAREALFAPLGIADAEWIAGRDGEAAAASGLRLRPRDLAKLGQLVLNRGLWGDRQLVPEAWLAKSFEARAEVEGGLEYGYHWWLGRLRGDGARWVAGFGNGGQRLAIFPSLDLAVVVLAGRYNQAEAWQLPVSALVDHVFPALKDE